MGESTVAWCRCWIISACMGVVCIVFVMNRKLWNSELLIRRTGSAGIWIHIREIHIEPIGRSAGILAGSFWHIRHSWLDRYLQVCLYKVNGIFGCYYTKVPSLCILLGLITPLCYHFNSIWWHSLTITVTAWWTWWRLKSPASPLLTQPFIRVQIQENIKALRHWPLCGEFNGQ